MMKSSNENIDSMTPGEKIIAEYQLLSVFALFGGLSMTRLLSTKALLLLLVKPGIGSLIIGTTKMFGEILR